jgi:hypothetical protein
VRQYVGTRTAYYRSACADCEASPIHIIETIVRPGETSLSFNSFTFVMFVEQCHYSYQAIASRTLLLHVIRGPTSQVL